MQATKKKVTFPPVFNISLKLKFIILAVITFCLYANTLSNEYALDDEAVVQHNEYVQRGVSGIGKILTTDAYDSYYRQNNSNQHLSGGRYRPLSLILFAIEHSLFGESNTIMHLINVLLYVLCVLAIFYFLRNILFKRLRYGEDMAFLSSILFAIHPIHTEVVANIKSSDEILSLLFFMLTLIFSIKYLESKKIKFLVAGLVCFLMALLSKEYAITLIILLPILHGLYFNKKIFKNISFVLPYFGILAFYLFIRIHYLGFPGNADKLDILNNPYKYANHAQKFGTEIFVLGKYLFMLFIPYPLSSDYGFAQIPLYNFSSHLVWMSLVVYVSILIIGFKLLQKKNILAFPIFFYLLNLFMVSNLIMSIGAPMGERLIFHSSLGFTTLVSFGIFELRKKCSPIQLKIACAILGLIVVLASGETFKRNMDWKNNFTLFTTDVKTVPNSVKANDNAGAQLINKSEATTDSTLSANYTHEGTKYLYKSISLDDSDITGYLNLGIAYCKLNEPDSSRKYWDMVKRLYPATPNLYSYYQILGKMYLFKGQELGRQGNVPLSIKKMELGIACDTLNPDIPFNIGGTFFNLQQFDSARYYWNKTAKLNPNYPALQHWMGMLPAPNP